MNRSLILKGGTIYEEHHEIQNGYILIDQGKIADIGFCRELPSGDFQIIELSENLSVVPGFIDLHIHGAGGADTMDATPEALNTIASILPKEGTTSFLATTITQSEDAINRALLNAGEFMKKQPEGQAEVLGVHLEGPFISRKRAGAQPESHITMPDVSLFQKYQKKAQNSIRLVTLAPEENGGLELVKFLSEAGVVPSVGHSDATYDKIVQAIQAGANHSTHLFNQMRGLHHREPGVVGAAMIHSEMKVELIADGIHTRPEILEFVYKNKGKEGIILITDAIRAKYLKTGTYDLGGQNVTVDGHRARLKDGTLAGSILKMNESFKNMMTFTSAEIKDVIQMAAENPARQLNIFDRKGSLASGKDADVTVLDENCNVVLTICRGHIAWEVKE
ncbi:N-acetylglucosamine 6-phosphate deacetylase [Melghiribacillus thermohalophilus]|uniref:N-acetylglucosamine-6-phosphate deacetylase n=1 Tax=Melghiribacillus thermohalophilus TaxID=1324956 RepID=A0A4R3MYL2_9BACI|nr:N-acetylglucosamine-6-phosphate deacetylase [Melghiribacillus thermohalophilus]TCT21758.1 N-acetylglucosamine 6-phosphate deacetylase [Melghiribacillus thermohalophilus]